MLGALALVVAGIGSAVVSSGNDGDTFDTSYQTLSASYTGADAPDADLDVDVSRNFDRDLLEKQAEQQVAQREQALADLAAQTQERADELQANQWVLPVTGYRITARFGQVSGLWASTHTGLDFAGPAGSTIVSVGAGTVRSVGYEGAYGNRTVIRLADGTDVWYCHQSRTAVSVGQEVAPGQIIGYTGSTGNVTGPHLHLEIHPGGGGPVNPEPVLAAHDVHP